VSGGEHGDKHGAAKTRAAGTTPTRVTWRDVEAQAAEVMKLTAALRLQALRAEIKATQALQTLHSKKHTEEPTNTHGDINDDDTHIEAASQRSPTPAAREDADEDTNNNNVGVDSDGDSGGGGGGGGEGEAPPCFHQHAPWRTELLNGSTPVAKYTVTDNGEEIHYHTLYPIPPEHEADTLEKLRRIVAGAQLNTQNTSRGLCVKILPHKEANPENSGGGKADPGTATTAKTTVEAAPGPRRPPTDTHSLLLRVRWWGIDTWLNLHGSQTSQGRGNEAAD